MNHHLCRLTLLGLAIGLSATGCNWIRSWRQPNQYVQPPQVFRSQPSRDEMIAAINANSQRVQSLQANGSLLIPNTPSLTTEIALERPRNFRFRAGTRLLGPELDVGSNGELFWFWANRDPTHSLYYARHDQFVSSKAGQAIPVEPQWIVEALGLVELDPQGTIEGPLPAGDRLQLRVRQVTPAGEVMKNIFVDAKQGTVVEQQLYDPRGQLLATAKASEHEFHQLDGVTLPHKIDVEIPRGQFKFQIVMDQHVINRPIAGGPSTFELPTAQLAGARPVDIADPSFIPPASQQPASASVPQPRMSSSMSPSPPKLRGFNPWR